MNAALRTVGFVIAIAIPLAACGSDAERVDEPSVKVVMAPTTLSATAGQDFIDALGRKWVCNGKVTPRIRDVAATEKNTPPTATSPTKPITSMSLLELAHKLRPRRLVGQYEYRLEGPDFYLAEKILNSAAVGTVPTTDEHAATVAAPTDTGVKSQFIIGSDDRSLVAFAGSPPFSSFGWVSQNCTATMIGRSTALSAAHCYYEDGTWTLTDFIAFGANNKTGTITTPFGQFVFDSITMPGAWETDTVHDWDFAVLEFSPTRYPGDSTGWRGTEWSMSGTQRSAGYPTDKAQGSQWYKSATYNFATGYRYNHNLDIMGGDSGACIYNTSSRCTSIQVAHYFTGTCCTNVWNESRRWDSTTYNFFDTYGNWPN